jgi:transposase
VPLLRTTDRTNRRTTRAALGSWVIVPRLTTLKLSDDERGKLEETVTSGSTPPRLAQRAQVVLLAAEGLTNREIAARVGMHHNRVAVWRNRFALLGCAGLSDERRSGRPPIHGLSSLLEIVRILTTESPHPAKRWSVTALAARLEEEGTVISQSQLWRVCNALDLDHTGGAPWFVSGPLERWLHRLDVAFVYVQPPHRAVVFSVGPEDAPVPVGLRHLGELAASQTSGGPGARLVPARALGDAARFADSLADRLVDAVLDGPPDAVLHCVVDPTTADAYCALLPVVAGRTQIRLHVSSNRTGWMSQVQFLLKVADRAGRGDAATPADPAARGVAALAGNSGRIDAIVEMLLRCEREGFELDWSADTLIDLRTVVHA